MQSVAARSLTAVVAPMGYGKTTLARALGEALGVGAYYYAVPAGPHDGCFVWHDMCVAFEAQGLCIAPALRRIGLPETASQARRTLDLFRNLGDQGIPICLMLDDYHHYTDRSSPLPGRTVEGQTPLSAHTDAAGLRPLRAGEAAGGTRASVKRMDAFWERTAKEALPNLHLVLFSRVKPGVNLEELRLKGCAALFGQDVLAFSSKETEAFFRANGIHDPAAAAESQEYSEGWPAVLRLCLQSRLAGGRLADAENIDSLLANTVFAAYSRDERDLLLRLAVPESFTDEDFRRIAATCRSRLNIRRLREKNPFLTRNAATGHYQFHGIFRDFLRRELASAAHIDKPSLYRLVGECCFERRDQVGAFRLFHQAGRDEDLSRLLDTFFRIEEDRNIFYFAEEYFRAAVAVPWRVRLQNPLGWLAVVYQYSQMWNDHRTAFLLDEAEEWFGAALDMPEYLRARLRGEIALIRACLAFNDADEMVRRYSEAVRLLNGPSCFAGEDAAWNFGSPSMSFISLRGQGVYGKLPEQGAQILRLYEILSGGKTRDSAKLIRAEYLLERGDFAGAELLFSDALAGGGGKIGDAAAALIGAFGHIRLSIALGRPREAFPELETLRPRVEAADCIGLFDCLDIALGYSNAVLGRLDAVPQWLRDGEMFDPPHNALPQIFGICLTVHAKALLLQGEYRRLMIAAKAIPDAAPIACLFARIHGAALQAIAAWHIKGRSEALALLREALELSRPDGVVLPLAEYGRHILPLLRRLAKSNAENGHGKDSHLEAVSALAGRIARLTALPAEERKGLLSPREKEIMRHVAQGETNPAIAEQLHISVNTVKDLLGKAFVKLGAFNRLDATKRFLSLYGEMRR